MKDPKIMKMRDLEKKTGVHRETIRTYLRHELIPEPDRPKRNVANYDERHVQAILAVRDLQTNSAMTLREIRSAITGDLARPHVGVSAFPRLEALVATRVGLDAQPILIKSLSNTLPNGPSDARRLAKAGLIDPIKTKDGLALSITDYRLVAIWGEMRAAGFTEELGFTPEMLTYYIKPAEYVAEREASLFLERTENVIDEAKAVEMLRVALRAMQDFFGLLRTKRFLRAVAELKKAAPDKDEQDATQPEPSAQDAPQMKAS